MRARVEKRSVLGWNKSQVTSNNIVVTQYLSHINGGTATAPVGGLHHMGDDVLASNYAVKKKSVCEHHKNYVSDPELSLFISGLQRVWNLN